MLDRYMTLLYLSQILLTAPAAIHWWCFRADVGRNNVINRQTHLIFHNQALSSNIFLHSSIVNLPSMKEKLCLLAHSCPIKLQLEHYPNITLFELLIESPCMNSSLILFRSTNS
jgi:hypothetical protein